MKNKMSDLEFRLTLRYLIGLTLIALTLIFSHFTFSKQASSNDKDAYLINVSGMQRMLSQRMALMAREIYHAETEAEASLYASKLKSVTETFKTNHAALTSGQLETGKIYTLTPALEKAYFGSMGIDTEISEYTRLSEELINLYNTRGLSAVRNSTLHKDIVSIARNGFLNRLNNIVLIYEKQAESKVLDISILAKIILAIGLALLLIEALFIFRPMVKRVVENIAELETSNAELVEFSYRISHDLRAPISSSLGLIKIAKQGVETDKKTLALGAMTHIDTAMKRLETLVEDIINLTKMKLADIPTEDVTLSELLDETIESIEHMENYDVIKIDVDNRVDSPVSVKKLFIGQTLQNLLSNAVKYYDPKKPSSFIEIKTRVENDKCVVDISDNGVGIPEDHRDELFGMFKRFHPKKSFGSGLGLYLVSENMKSIDGNVTYSPLKDGTKFTVKFPLRA